MLQVPLLMMANVKVRVNTVMGKTHNHIWISEKILHSFFICASGGDTVFAVISALGAYKIIQTDQI